MQGQQRLRQRRLPGLSQESLQHTGLRHQEGSQWQQQEALPEDAFEDALQTYDKLTAQTTMIIMKEIPRQHQQNNERNEKSAEKQVHEAEEALGPVCGQCQGLNWRESRQAKSQI